MLETIRSFLALPKAYQLFFNVIGAPGRSRILVREYIRPKPGDRILEIGCGPGTIVPYLPVTEYVGFDASPEYIEQARNRFPGAKFVCQRVSQFTLAERNYFDIVLALGILHHLEDEEALQLFKIAHAALQPGGKLVTLDGVWTKDQSRASRYIQARDRGQFIREEKAYIKLAEQIFPNIASSIRHDLLRIPYTHLILECTR
jgi:cyclopropane fatty-acyl-phospholipid synthase-like methyltransferase